MTDCDFELCVVSAQIPIKNDPEANQKAMDKVKADKVREVTAGHDGTCVPFSFYFSLSLLVPV